MNADITLKTRAFNLIYSDKTESLRRNTTDGAAEPYELRIAHTPYTDKATGVAGTRSVLRLDVHKVIDESTKPLVGSAYMVVVRPHHAEFTTEVVTDMVAIICQALVGTGADANALGLDEEIFVNNEQ